MDKKPHQTGAMALATGSAHKPATALPWKSLEVETPLDSHYGNAFKVISDNDWEIATLRADGSGTQEQDAAYIVHAANACPQLVEAARAIESARARGDTDAMYVAMAEQQALLRELGESA